MIKVDKHKVHLEGDERVLAAEISMAIRSLYKVLAEQHGEDAAKEMIEHCYKRALEPQPEPKDLIKQILKDILASIEEDEKEGEELWQE